MCHSLQNLEKLLCLVEGIGRIAEINLFSVFIFMILKRFAAEYVQKVLKIIITRYLIFIISNTNYIWLL